MDPLHRDRPAILPRHGVLLAAGSSGAERLPPRRDGGSTAWHRPEHIRDRAAARQRLIGTALAGADVILAPAYLTHRRALSPYGETRRAAEWTREAVEVAREAAELAQEQGAQQQDAASAGTYDREDVRPIARPRGRVLIAGPMSPLRRRRFEDRLDPGLMAEEDRERADLLVDAGVDLLIVESMPGLVEARSATGAAVRTGIPVWAGLRIAASSAHLPSGDALEAVWQELADLRPEAVLIEPVSLAASGTLEHVLRLVDVPVGLWFDAASAEWATPEAEPEAPVDQDSAATEPDGSDPIDGWLDGSARIIGLAAGATSERVGRVRAVLDRRLAADADRRTAEQGAWRAAVEDAATRARGGRAAWVGSDPPVSLPPTFDWTSVDGPSALRLAQAAFGLIIATDPDSPADAARALTSSLDDGGYLLLRTASPMESIPDGLSVVSIAQVARALATLLRLDH